MDTFFALLKKSLVATIFVIFAFVGTYVPQTWNQPEVAHAGGAGGGYTIPQGALALVEQAGVNIAATASWVLDKVIAFAQNALYLKEYILDGIAWVIAKGVVASMVNELISWINSGFEGSPAFVQDLSDFLLNAADISVGNYVEDILGDESYICEPFRLDVAVAVATQYQRTRIDQPAPDCTLTGALENIEDFISGEPGTFAENGGWDTWFKITSSPGQYTPYGAVINAQQGAERQVLNTKSEEKSLLDFGDGFMSGKICQTVTGTNDEQCFISKPGKVIAEALHSNLDSGRQSLITADELDEILASLLGQLANTAITGAAGLLGLSGGTGATYNGYAGSYLEELANNANQVDSTNVLASMEESLAVQESYIALANEYIPQLSAFSVDVSQSPGNRLDALEAIDDANVVIQNSNLNIATLNALIAEMRSLENLDDAVSNARKAEIANEFSQLSVGTLYIEPDVSFSHDLWQGILDRPAGDSNSPVDFTASLARMEAALSTQAAYRDLANSYQPDLLAYSVDATNDPIKRSQAATAVNEISTILSNTSDNIDQLSNMISTFNNPSTSDEEKNAIVTEFLLLGLYTDGDISNAQVNWDDILTAIDFGDTPLLMADALAIETEYNTLANNAIPTLSGAALDTAIAIADLTTQNITELTDMVALFDDPNGTEGDKSAAVDTFTLMTLHSSDDIANPAWGI